MGFFGSFMYDGASWRDWDLDAQPGTLDLPRGPWLSVIIHDSDIATLQYSPSGAGSGTAFLGVTPRIYFEDPRASQATEPAREAEGLAAWVAQTQRRANVEHLTDLIRPFLAADVERDDGEADDLDDAEVLVEIKVVRLLTALDLPLPADLAE